MKYSPHHLKISTIALFLISGFLSAGQVLADDCQVTLSDSNVDFGRVMQSAANDALNAGNMYALGNRMISLNAICPKDSKIVLNLRGAQLGEQFKFAKQGSISVSLSNAQLDGRRVDLAQVEPAGAVAGAFASSILAAPGDSVIPVSGGVPAKGAVLSVQIEVRPIVPVAELRTREATTMESNLSFEVRSY